MSRSGAASGDGDLATIPWVLMAVVVLGGSVWGGQWLRGILAPPTVETSTAMLPTPQQHSSAQAIYQMACANCHGSEGLGDGPAAMAQPPRSFPGDSWRFPKTQASIRQVIADGIPASSMPGFRQTLTADQIEALADHVLQLADGKVVGGTPDPLDALIQQAGFVAAPSTPAPPLVVCSSEGDPIDLGELRGQVVLLHFWSTTCVHCLAEFSTLGELKANAPLRLLSVCVDQQDWQAVGAIGRQHAAGQTLYVDQSGLVAQRFQVQSLPSFVLIDPAGQVVATRSGSAAWEPAAVERLVRRLAKPPQG